MTRIKTSLLKIVGRIKEYMSAVWLGIAGILIPLAVIIATVGSKEYGLLAIAFVVAGAFCLIFAGIAAQKEENKRDNKYSALITELRQERNEHYTVLRGLIEEMQRERNERRNSNH